MKGASDQRRDDVLRAFHAACPRPTAAEIADWVKLNPDFAVDIREHAEAALQMARTANLSTVPSAALVRRSQEMTEHLLRQALGPEPSAPPKPRKRPLPWRDDR